MEFNFLLVRAAVESLESSESNDPLRDELQEESDDDPITESDRKDFIPGDDELVEQQSLELEVEAVTPLVLLG